MLAQGESSFGEVFLPPQPEFCSELLTGTGVTVSGVQPGLCCLLWHFCAQFSAGSYPEPFPRSSGVAAVGCAAPEVWVRHARPRLGVLGKADLQPRSLRVWKLKCVELVPVLGREKQQLMEPAVGDKCKGCLLGALVMVLGQDKLCCAPQMELSGVPAWTCLK